MTLARQRGQAQRAAATSPLAPASAAVLARMRAVWPARRAHQAWVMSRGRGPPSGRGRRGGVPPGPARGLAGEPAHRAGRSLFQQGPQGEAPFADPVTRARRLGAGRQAAAGEDETAPDRAGEHVQQGVQAVAGRARFRRGAQGQRQPPAGVGVALGLQRTPGQARPGHQAGRPEVGDGVQVAGQPGPQVLPEQRVPGPGERVGGRGRAGVAGRLAEGGVQAEQGGQVVRLRGRREADGPPEPGGPVGGVAAEAALGAQVHRGVGRAVEDEDLGVLGVARPRPAEGGACGPGVGRVAGHGAQGAEQFPSPRRRGRPRPVTSAFPSGRRPPGSRTPRRPA